jgi:hypothetical protein
MVNLESDYIHNEQDCEIMLGPAVQFRGFKLPLEPTEKYNNNFHKDIFVLD